MKIAISNLAWKNEDDARILSYLQKIGVEAIEIAPLKFWGVTDYNAIVDCEDKIRMLEQLYGIRVASMQSIWYGIKGNLFDDKENYELYVNHTKKIIDLASEIGAGNLVFGSPKSRVIHSEDDFSIAEKFFAEVGEYALEKNTCFSIEANPSIYGGNFILESKEAFEWCKRINLKSVRVNYDFGTVIANDESLKVLEDNLEYVNHIHISEPGLVLIKEREQHRELASILCKNKYDKFISIEMGENNEDDVKKTLDYVKRVFG